MARDPFDRIDAIGGGAAMRTPLGSLFQFGLGMFTQRAVKVWFVNSKWGSDTSVGTDIKKPLKTIQAAINKAGTRGGSAATNDAKGDVIVLQASDDDYDDDTVGASLANAYLYVNKKDLTILGMGPPNSVRIKPAAAATAGAINLGANADRFRLINVTIDTTTALSAAIVTASGAHFPTIEDCIFNLVGAAGPLGVGIDFDAGAVNYPVIRNCDFYLGALMIAAIKMECGTTGGLIEDCMITSNAAANPSVDGILVKAGSNLHINRCWIHGGVAAQNITDGIDIDAGVLRTLITECQIGGCDNAITDGGTDTLGATGGITAIS
jgi:hypothetical protein